MFLANGPGKPNHNWNGDKIQGEVHCDFAFHLNETWGNIDALSNWWYQLPGKFPDIFCKFCMFFVCSFHFDYKKEKKEKNLYSSSIRPVSKSCPLQRKTRAAQTRASPLNLASPLQPILNLALNCSLTWPQGLQTHWPWPGSGGHWWYDQDNS